jgi:iron complex transport system permease protein
MTMSRTTVPPLSTVPAAPPPRRRTTGIFLVLLVVLALSVLAGISLGSIAVAPGVVARVAAASVLPHGRLDISQVSEADRVVVWLIRLPRVLVAALVGASLTLAGVQMQGLFKTLASPDIVGTSAGGAFGTVLAVARGQVARSLLYVPLFAFFRAVMALFAVYTIAMQYGHTPWLHCCSLAWP